MAPLDLIFVLPLFADPATWYSKLPPSQCKDDEKPWGARCPARFQVINSKASWVGLRHKELHLSPRKNPTHLKQQLSATIKN